MNVLAGIEEKMDQQIKSVLIVPDRTHQTSVQQPIENAMDVIKWVIICEYVQMAKMIEPM